MPDLTETQFIGLALALLALLGAAGLLLVVMYASPREEEEGS
jgi:hypothetical protein